MAKELSVYGNPLRQLVDWTWAIRRESRRGLAVFSNFTLGLREVSSGSLRAWLQKVGFVRWRCISGLAVRLSGLTLVV